MNRLGKPSIIRPRQERDPSFHLSLTVRPSRPVTSTMKERTPLWAETTFMLVGSPTMTADGLFVCAAISAIMLGAPKQPISSS